MFLVWFQESRHWHWNSKLPRRPRRFAAPASGRFLRPQKLLVRPAFWDGWANSWDPGGGPRFADTAATAVCVVLRSGGYDLCCRGWYHTWSEYLVSLPFPFRKKSDDGCHSSIFLRIFFIQTNYIRYQILSILSF